MNPHLQEIYIRILKYNWKILNYEDLGNGCITISIYEKTPRNWVKYFLSYGGNAKITP